MNFHLYYLLDIKWLFSTFKGFFLHKKPLKCTESQFKLPYYIWHYINLSISYPLQILLKVTPWFKGFLRLKKTVIKVNLS